MNRQLPLFPLNTVLFPGGVLPLRIFEPRYLDLLKAAIEADYRFGVVLIKNGVEVAGDSTPHEIGTVARIAHIGEPDRSVIPLVVVGEQRFRIVSIDRDDSFSNANVELLDDELGDLNSDLPNETRRAIGQYVANRFASIGTFSAHTNLKIPDDPAKLSYIIGSTLEPASPNTRYALLAAETVSQRLEMGLSTLVQETEILRKSIMHSGPSNRASRFSTN